jgi:hypothetical protein
MVHVSTLFRIGERERDLTEFFGGQGGTSEAARLAQRVLRISTRKPRKADY